MSRLWIVCLLAPCLASVPDLPTNYVAGRLIQLNDNGGWSWFMDERAIVDDDKLIVGSVRGWATVSPGRAVPHGTRQGHGEQGAALSAAARSAGAMRT